MSKETKIDFREFESNLDQTLEILSAFKRSREKGHIASGAQSSSASSNKSMPSEWEKPIYKQIKKLGEGGMKEISLSKDMRSLRQVAYAKIKKGREKGLNLRRFVREARITAMLEHPNIIPIHDFGVQEDGMPYFTMKYLEGDSLQELLEKLSKGEESLLREYSLARLVQIFLQICEGIAYAHSKGVLHLDLKPANIHISPFGEVLILDWGISSYTGDADTRESIEHVDGFEAGKTMTGTLKGTPGFMAPEQIDPKLGEVGEYTDVYQLGCLLYALLTFRPPIQEGELEHILQSTLEGHWMEDVDMSRDAKHRIPKPLRAVIFKAMAINPSDRYSSTSSLIDDLQAYLEGYSTSAWNAGLLDKGLLAYRRHQAKVLTAMTFVGLLGFAALLLAWQQIRSQKKIHFARKVAQDSQVEAKDSEEKAMKSQAMADLMAIDVEEKNLELEDLRSDIQSNFDVARNTIEKMVEYKLNELKERGYFDQLRFMMLNDEVSAKKFSYDMLWMLYAHPRVPVSLFKSQMERLKDSADNPALFTQVGEILVKMQSETSRVSVEECHLALSILRDQATLSPYQVGAYVMKSYHERFLQDPEYPNYLEELTALHAPIKSRRELEVTHVKFEVEKGAWSLVMETDVPRVSLSMLAFLPIEHFKGKGLKAVSYSFMSKWPLKSLDLEYSDFKILDPIPFESYQLDFMRLIQCPKMNWPRLLDLMPTKELVLEKRASQYLNTSYMEKNGVIMKVE